MFKEMKKVISKGYLAGEVCNLGYFGSWGNHGKLKGILYGNLAGGNQGDFKVLW